MDPTVTAVQPAPVDLISMYKLLPVGPAPMDNMTKESALWRDAVTIDRLDADLLALLDAQPRIGVLEASRRLGVARGTVQARLDRLRRTGVIAGLSPTLEPAALGFPITAFATLEIAQGRGHEQVVAHLTSIVEVLEAHTITGSGDLLVRVAARDNADLQRVIDEIVDGEHVLRSSTAIALQTQIPLRRIQLVDAAVAGR